MSHIVNVNDAEFESLVLNAKQPVLLDFWAQWCGPCLAVAPTLEALAEEFAGRATIAKINIDENPEIPAKFGIRGIPTLLLFKNGEIAETLVGALPKAEFVNALNKHI